MCIYTNRSTLLLLHYYKTCIGIYCTLRRRINEKTSTVPAIKCQVTVCCVLYKKYNTVVSKTQHNYLITLYMDLQSFLLYTDHLSLCSKWLQLASHAYIVMQ